MNGRLMILTLFLDNGTHWRILIPLRLANLVIHSNVHWTRLVKHSVQADLPPSPSHFSGSRLSYREVWTTEIHVWLALQDYSDLLEMNQRFDDAASAATESATQWRQLYKHD